MIDDLFRNTVCNVIGTSYGWFLDKLWIEAGIDDKGEPQNNGEHCPPVPPYHPPSSIPIPGVKKVFPPYSQPDFLFRNVAPLDTSNNPQGYLIGDVKFDINKVSIQTDKQFKSILSYAKFKNVGSINKESGGHQYLPLAIYFSVYGGSPQKKVQKTQEYKMREWAMEKYGVVFEVLSLFPYK